MATFDDATAVSPHHDGATFDVALDRAWTIGEERPNGGYLLALLGRAALASARAAGAEQDHVIAASVQYVTSPSVGAAVITTELLRRGRSASQVRARLRQGGQAAVEALFTLGHLDPASQPWWGAVPPVTLPPEDQCVPLPLPPEAGDGPTFRQQVDERFDPSTIGFSDGQPGGDGELRCWFRFADGREPDTLSLLFVVDALPPATFDIVATGWVPTLDLSVYVRAVPEPGPLRVRFRTGVSTTAWRTRCVRCGTAPAAWWPSRRSSSASASHRAEPHRLGVERVRRMRRSRWGDHTDADRRHRCWPDGTCARHGASDGSRS